MGGVDQFKSETGHYKLIRLIDSPQDSS